MKIISITRGPISRSFGLGDAVEAVAGPIAGAIDKAFGTSLRKCPECGRRRRALNKIVPNLLPGVDVKKD